MKFKARLGPYWESFSYWGLVFATIFFSASLTPSLLPRHYIVQGLLSGLALAVGYGVGVFVVWIWRYLELRQPSKRLEYIAKRATTVVVVLYAVFFLWRATVWQNSIRELMEMPPLRTAYPIRVALIAILCGAVLVGFGRILHSCYAYITKKINHILPRRVANFLGVVVVGFVLLLIVNDVFAKLALKAADAVSLKYDSLVDQGIRRPELPLASGSTESLIPWDTIGRQGKDFIVRGPTRDQLRQFWDKDVLQPLRVYVGLRTRETTQERAKLALAELQRVGGFDRSILVVATPTGTGWLDPGAVDTLEYLHAGDTAIVSMQYSYLPSWITILVDPDRSRVAARTLFNEIYGHWKTLPKDKRPQLYLHGLSLGSLGSEVSAKFLDFFEDPIHGALWSGPPFPSTTWRAVTEARNPESPAWLPTFQDSRVVRFTGQKNSLQEVSNGWSSIRFVYIQYASDPMVFFSPSLLYQKPAWLVGERGPDVSPYLRWNPIITFLQIAFDLPMATSVPIGYGHNYAPADYIDGWIEVTQPENWENDDTERLKKEFADKKFGPLG